MNLDPKLVFKALEDDGTFATVLHLIALIAYGPQVYEVDHAEVILELEDQFHCHITQENTDKLSAILVATATDAFYDDAEAFRGICETLSNGDPGVEMLDSLTLPEIVFGLYEVELNHGPGELTPSVEALVKKVTGMEADDLDETVGVDAYAYVWAYLREQHEMLSNQLLRLGVHRQDIPPIENPHSFGYGEDNGVAPEETVTPL